MTGDKTVTTEETTAARIRREAGAWHAAMQSGEASAKTRAAFENWLRAAPEHRRAYSAFEDMYRDLGVLLPLSGVTAQSTRRSGVAGLAWLFDAGRGARAASAAAALALVVGVMAIVARPGLFDRPAEPAAQVYATAIAEISDISLADGSSVTLGGALANKSCVYGRLSARRSHLGGGVFQCRPQSGKTVFRLCE